jgi:hypothetical protein
MKKIKDYINKGDYAVFCSSKEEWDNIVTLIQEHFKSKPYGDYQKSKYEYLNLNNINRTIGVGSLNSFSKFTIFNASEFLQNEEKYTYEVVHCINEEQWDFIKRRCRPISLMYKHKWEDRSLLSYPEGVAICTSEDSYCGLNYWKEHNSLILSFEEYCKKYSYSPDCLKKKEVLGFCDIGDIVVSLSKPRFSDRKIGDIYKVLPKSSKLSLYYTVNDLNNCASEWRLATDKEVIAFNKGIKNINEIPLKEFPEEGFCISLDERLSKYLVDRPFNNPDNTTKKENAVGIGWNKSSCWWLITPDKSTKPKYELSQLEKFLPVKQSKIENKTEDLLKEARERYPIGTKFKSMGDSEKIIEVTGNNFCIDGNDIILHYNSTNIPDSMWSVYTDKKWAELVKESKSQFEVSKWYKVTENTLKNTYFKFKEIDISNAYNKIYCFDRIWMGSYSSEQYFANTNAEKSSILLTDLTEIQQYLPLYHIDAQKYLP